MTLKSDFWKEWTSAGELTRVVLVEELLENVVARYIKKDELLTVAAIISLYFEDLMQYLKEVNV